MPGHRLGTSRARQGSHDRDDGNVGSRAQRALFERVEDQRALTYRPAAAASSHTERTWSFVITTKYLIV